LAGKPSHGIMRLLRENYGVFVEGKREEPEYIHKTKVSTLIDGKGNPGMLVGPLAMNEAVRIAKDHDIAVVGTKGSINTTGSLSYYCEKIAKENLIGIVMSQSSPMIAPFNSIKALFGTNPIAFGIPSSPQPFIFDMSTAAITFGEIARHRAESSDLPPNVAIDKNGTLTKDPKQVFGGAILPIGNSFKGSGLAMMIEILSALWTGASYGGLEKEQKWGNLYMAFSTQLLSDLELFKSRMFQLISTMKEVATRDDKPLRLPGEHTLKVRDQNIKEGVVEINVDILAKIKKNFSL
jgi:ureidoglycolate dehydrogenase (NAD+)